MEVGSIIGLGFGLIATVALLALIIFVIHLRKVVPTNMVHIVQSGTATTSYGKDMAAGNAYYAWPASLPRLGVSVIALPVSNFEVPLKDYDAYDKDRVPFMVDITAFVHIANTEVAAQRVASFEELEAQLRTIVQGAVRKVLASDNIDNIMTQRSTFGEAFTQEVSDGLMQWGVETVKSMELMDIRDAKESRVIADIMAKKISDINRESRIAVATNNQEAEMAELRSKQEVDLRREEVEQAVGKRKAEREQAVGMANEVSRQEVLELQKETTQRNMEVRSIEETREAQIASARAVIQADQERQTQELIAQGQLKAKEFEAQGIKAEGNARAEAATAMQMAPVEAQVALAKEIGSNEGYQQFLAMKQALETHLAVGTEQARALQGADVKVIANSNNASGGVSNVMDLFSGQGGTQLAAMVEAFAQSGLGSSFFASMLNSSQASSNSDVMRQNGSGDTSEVIMRH